MAPVEICSLVNATRREIGTGSIPGRSDGVSYAARAHTPKPEAALMMLRSRFLLATVLSLGCPFAAATAQRLDELSAAHLTIQHSELSTQPSETARWFGRGSSSRVTNTLRGAVWGLAIYGVWAVTYIVHEKTTCNGPDCFGEGFAWIGLIDTVPVAAGVGAFVGMLWPTGSD